MKEIKSSEQCGVTGKAAYVKPTIQVYELEVEEGILYGDSGDDFGNGGRYSQAAHSSRGNIWENEETI